MRRFNWKLPTFAEVVAVVAVAVAAPVAAAVASGGFPWWFSLAVLPGGSLWWCRGNQLRFSNKLPLSVAMI